MGNVQLPAIAIPMEHEDAVKQVKYINQVLQKQADLPDISYEAASGVDEPKTNNVAVVLGIAATLIIIKRFI